MRRLFILTIMMCTYSACAQNVSTLNGVEWMLSQNTTKETYKGKDCLKTTNKGTATAKDITFRNGVIEYDVCIQKGRGFAGVRFRGDENGNTEEFYIRKHQSGNPDAMQYTPVYNNNAGWQLYHGDGYSTAKKYVFDEWFHIKLVVVGTQAEVYIEDMEKPVLAIHELKMGDCEGQVSFYGPARFANVTITENNSPTLKSTFKEVVKPGKEVIQKYSLSEPLNGEVFLAANKLNDQVSGLVFKDVATEADGLLNISKYTKLSRQKSAVLLQFEVMAEMEIIKELRVGFSDAAKLYLNNKAVWFGIDNYRSRDYRFLGTIGYFDSVFLDLKKGKNTITVVVAESFGGWGFKAMFNNLEGISVQ